VKLLLDENLSPAHAARLRETGHDAVAVLDVGLGGAADPVVREFALAEQRVLVTIDADFSHIVRFPPENTPGVPPRGFDHSARLYAWTPTRKVR
jgi:predicted nuclease of predicted toxin-antitoxin system